MIFDGYLRSKKTYMLFILPLVVVIAGIYHFYYGRNLPQEISTPALLPSHIVAYLKPEGKVYILYLFTLGIAYLLFFINTRYKFLAQQTTLPAVIYVLLTFGLIMRGTFSWVLVFTFFISLAFIGLLGAINNTKSNRYIFNFGFWITLAVLFYPKFILLVLWAFCVLFFSGRSTLKDIMALLVGILTPVYFTFFYYYWTDQLNEFISLFKENLLAGEYLRQLTTIQIVRYSTLLFLLFISLYYITIYYPVSMVSQRRSLLSLVSMLFFCLLTLLFIPGIHFDVMYLVAFPLSYIYSQYFVTSRLPLLRNVLFLFLLGVCLVFEV